MAETDRKHDRRASDFWRLWHKVFGILGGGGGERCARDDFVLAIHPEQWRVGARDHDDHLLCLGPGHPVAKSGGPANGVQTDYSFDPAGNRTNVKVANSPNGNGSTGGGASAGTQILVVVPLNGYTVIPLTIN